MRYVRKFVFACLITLSFLSIFIIYYVRQGKPSEGLRNEQVIAIARLDVSKQWKQFTSEPTIVVGVVEKLSGFIQSFTSSRVLEITNLTMFQSPLLGLFAGETITYKNTSNLSHVIVHFQDGSTVIFVQLFPLPTNLLFCYGMEIGKTYPTNSNSCPPCICSSVFSRWSMIILTVEDIFTANLPLFNKSNEIVSFSRFIPCIPMRNGTKQITNPSDIFLIGDSSDFPNQSEPVRAVRSLFEHHDMPLVLDSGTLLGWYRNCSVIDGDIDIDLSVPSSHLNQKFYQNILYVGLI